MVLLLGISIGSRTATLLNLSEHLPTIGRLISSESPCTSMRVDITLSPTTGSKRSPSISIGPSKLVSISWLTGTPSLLETPMTEVITTSGTSGDTFPGNTETRATFSMKSVTSPTELTGDKSKTTLTPWSKWSDLKIPTQLLLSELPAGHQRYRALTLFPTTTSCTPSTSTPHHTTSKKPSSNRPVEFLSSSPNTDFQRLQVIFI